MAELFGIDRMVRDWYMEAYPKDVMRKNIKDNVTFRDMVAALNRNENPMYLIDVYDSFVRDRIFGKIAVLSGVSYDVVYNKWMLGDRAPEVPIAAQPSLESKISEAEDGKAVRENSASSMDIRLDF